MVIDLLGLKELDEAVDVRLQPILLGLHRAGIVDHPQDVDFLYLLLVEDVDLERRCRAERSVVPAVAALDAEQSLPDRRRAAHDLDLFRRAADVIAAAAESEDDEQPTDHGVVPGGRQTFVNVPSGIASCAQTHLSGQSASTVQFRVQTFPLSFFRHRCDWHAAGPKAQAEPTPPPPSGKQTLTALPSVPFDCCKVPD